MVSLRTRNALVSGTYILNVQTDYYAQGNGTSDDTAQLQAALNDAATLPGAVVFFPYGIYMISGTLYVYGNISLLGVGMDASILRAIPGMNAWMLVYSSGASQPNYIPGSRSAMGRMAVQLQPVRNGMGRMNVAAVPPGILTRISDLTIDQDGGNQTAGGCVYAPGVARSNFERVHFTQPYDAGLWLDTIGHSGNGQNRISGCTFDYGSYSSFNGQGLRMTGNNLNVIESCSFVSNGGYGTSVNNWHIQYSAGKNFYTNCNFYAGGDGIRVLSNADEARITACNFYNVGGNAIYMAGRHSGITNNLFRDGGYLARNVNCHVVLGESYNEVSNNSFWSEAGNGVLRSFVQEFAGVVNNIIGPNHMYVGLSKGFLGTGPVEFGGGTATHIFANNGHNPIGFNVTQPALPASGINYLNKTGYDCMVSITGGTVTIINISGFPTGLTSGNFRVPVGQSISVTYTVAPTWKWFGD